MDRQRYPNPVSNGTINLQLANEIKGWFIARLINPLGQTILIKNIAHTGSDRSEAIKSEGDFATGIYHLEVRGPDNKISVIKVLVQ